MFRITGLEVYKEICVGQVTNTKANRVSNKLEETSFSKW